MKPIKLTFLLTILMSMIGVKASAHDIEVANSDGVTIYYNYYHIDNDNGVYELSVTYRGSSWSDYSNEYSGKVVIPESVTYEGIDYKVTSIGNDAFFLNTLTSITIPNSVTSIGDRAFCECSSLTSITIPNSVTTIGDVAFSGCKGLISVTIGNSVTSIGAWAFSECSSLTSITIPNSVTSIGDGAFDECLKLTSITIPNSVTSIGDRAFGECSSLTSITIPNSVTTIGDYAFKSCTGLTSITIPNSVMSIGKEAFFGCSTLTSITIGNSVTNIGRYAFAGCSAVTSITIPNSLTSIGDGVFSRCSALTFVTIPNSVTSIGDCAFYECSSLTSVNIPNSVTSIGTSAFYGCTGFTSVTIGNSVKSIGNSAFACCTGLTSITIPNSVTNIDSWAFDACYIPVVISLIENPFAIFGITNDFGIFSNNTFNNATLYVPVGTIDKYKTTEGWKDFLIIEEGTGDGGNTPRKCATPTITYKDGKLSFSCDTEGVEYKSSVECMDNKTFSGKGISLRRKYRVSVYATKAGYENSNTATSEIEVSYLKDDVNGDGEVNVTDIVTLVNIIMSE